MGHRQNDAYCDIALTSSDFMLGGSAGACSDAVVFGTNQLCGSTFGTSGQLNWNYTGSYNALSCQILITRPWTVDSPLDMFCYLANSCEIHKIQSRAGLLFYFGLNGNS